ncbi:HupE/UreJ family protein [Thiotrichales bacterium HSG14]|nr:HupE/UreJ family protein [Thiotrichales bacterium HSG14]
MIKQSRWFMAYGLLVILVTLVTSQVFGHGMSEAEKQTIIEGGNLHYILIGATHMLSGYDHLAFVFGIIFFLTRFKDIVKYITAFTLGHSVTLIFATFNAIQVNYFLIDAVIALSVCYIAFVNLDGFKKYLNINNPPNMLGMIVGLGLIHGLGLSTRLQQLPLSEDHLLMNIISFNVGIEVGQISALALMLLLIAAFRKSHAFPTFSLIANYTLILVGSYLFLMQMHGYEHSSYPNEFIVSTESSQQRESNQQKESTENFEAFQQNWKDTIQITIPAKGDKEYKLWLEKDATLEYAWQTDGVKLFFDFHGEPAGDTTGYFKSFKESTNNRSSGSLTASFEGTHGWYWKNNNTLPVIVTLKAKGEYQRLE